MLSIDSMQGDKGTRCKSVTTAITVIGFTISRDTYRSVFCKKLSGRLEGKQKQNHFDLFRMRLPYGGRFLRYLLVSIYKKEEKYETDTKRERRFKFLKSENTGPRLEWLYVR